MAELKILAVLLEVTRTDTKKKKKLQMNITSFTWLSKKPLLQLF